DEDIRPTVVVHIKKTAAPAEVLRVLAEAALISGVLEIRAAKIVVERRRVAGEIRFDQIEIAVEIVIGGGNAHAGLWLAVGAERGRAASDHHAFVEARAGFGNRRGL